MDARLENSLLEIAIAIDFKPVYISYDIQSIFYICNVIFLYIGK